MVDAGGTIPPARFEFDCWSSGFRLSLDGQRRIIPCGRSSLKAELQQSIEQRSTHTIRLRRRSQGIARNPRQGLASHIHSITAHRLRPDHSFREQATHRTRHATSTTGTLVAAIRLRGTRWILELVHVLGHFSPAARPDSFLLSHAATCGLRELWRITRTTGSGVRKTSLYQEQNDERPAEHAFIVRRAGALGKRGQRHR